MTYQKILEELRKRIFHPLYFLTGDEPYFIDLITDTLANSVLDPADREFNQTLVYGNDVTVSAVLDMARRYPMLAPYQVIIVKEAQEIRDIEGLGFYAENPVPTTILLFCYKYKKLDKRKAFVKTLQNKAVFFESKKLYDNQVSDWIINYTREKGFTLDLKVATVLTDHIGTDLNRMVTEMQKLMINLPSGSNITVDHVEKYIGISKDYNVFELQKAIGEHNIFKVNHIAYYMAANPRENPIQKLIPVLYSFFLKILIFHSLPDKRNGVAAALGVPPIFVNDYTKAAYHYPPAKVESVIAVLREYDLRSKGVNNESTSEPELIREMLYKILH